MRNRIVGPVSMITVGVLFLCQYFTPYRFRQTWPLLLIAIGIALVMERSQYGQSDGDGQAAPTSSSTGTDINSEKR
ncbi:MAG: hypothetical protein HYX28_11180 [Candidatus Koribacter versatilis]|uniref:LiaI-LiaF-like transmembrane region domain-containing protein n=1 Tax=Candidatus Korobacter versatilis TaxID=658062 RepID=A0A932EQX6_9BACT|nr:hypothetical protein [Candidatus Koribacter versatilis]